MNIRPSRRHRRSAAAGFTLIEIMVAIGIVVLLVAVALPMLNAARKQAKKTRAAADLQAISTGLEAYKTDFGDYPRVDQANTGFALIGKTLVSPAPSGGPLLPAYSAQKYDAGSVVDNGSPPGTPEYRQYVAFGRPDPEGGFSTTAAQTDVNHWAVFPVSDGSDGPGFRARPGGKPYGPYLQPDKFRLRGLAILDQWDNPVLYSPARPKKPAANPAGEWPFVLPSPDALFNVNDNIWFFARPGEGAPTNAAKRLEAMLVQGIKTPYDGIIENGEQPATTGPFTLWSAGADGNFGPTFAGADPTKDEISKVDDITNFTTGQ